MLGLCGRGGKEGLWLGNHLDPRRSCTLCPLKETRSPPNHQSSTLLTPTAFNSLLCQQRRSLGRLALIPLQFPERSVPMQLQKRACRAVQSGRNTHAGDPDSLLLLAHSPTRCSSPNHPSTAACRAAGVLVAVQRAPRRPCSTVRVAAYLPSEAAVPEKVSTAFKRLQNGSDIRGVALSCEPWEREQGPCTTELPGHAFQNASCVQTSCWHPCICLAHSPDPARSLARMRACSAQPSPRRESH